MRPDRACPQRASFRPLRRSLPRSGVGFGLVAAWHWVAVRHGAAPQTVVARPGDSSRRAGAVRIVSTGYALAYGVGFTPWERYGSVAVASIGAMPDLE